MRGLVREYGPELAPGLAPDLAPGLAPDLASPLVAHYIIGAGLHDALGAHNPRGLIDP